MKEKAHANGNESGPLLSVVEGQAGEVERGSDLSVQHRTIVANGQDPPQRKKEGTKLKKIDAKFLDALRRRAEHYRSDALDQLHAIAMQEIGEDSKALHVKFLAAQKLVDLRIAGEDAPPTSIDLTALREAYNTQSMRIRQVREKTVTYVDPAEPIDGSISEG